MAARDQGEPRATPAPTTWCGWTVWSRRLPRSGDLVLLYHLLWELTHVVFEHPGLLTSEAECTDEVCVTCSDEGRVAEVRGVLAEGRVEVLAGGRVEQIDGRLVDGLRPGDLVVVHAGVAITSLMAGRGS